MRLRLRMAMFLNIYKSLIEKCWGHKKRMILEDLKTAVNAVLAIHLYFIQHLPIAIIIDKCRVDLVTSENYAH